MNLIKPKSQTETDLAAKDESILSVVEAAHNLAAKLSNAHRAFWALPDDRLLAVLNADVQRTLATFAANTGLGEAVNAALDAVGLPQFAARAPVTMGRADITFDGQAFAVAETQQ